MANVFNPLKMPGERVASDTRLMEPLRHLNPYLHE